MDSLDAVDLLREMRAKVRRNAEGYAQANADAKVAECNAQADALTAAIAALTPAAGTPVAWWDGDDRVINRAAKEAGIRTGGATASATAAYTIPLYPPTPEGWPARYFASGPQGSFFTDDLTFANALINAADYDRDEWTITDLENPEGV